MKKCYTILTVVYDLDENGEHFGDAVIDVQVAENKDVAEAVLTNLEDKFAEKFDEDGEPQDYRVERTANGLTATNDTTETIIKVEEQVMA